MIEDSFRLVRNKQAQKYVLHKERGDASQPKGNDVDAWKFRERRIPVQSQQIEWRRSETEFAIES